MATTRQVLELLLAGRTAVQMMDQLGIPPSKLRRALSSPRLGRVCRLQADVARFGQGFRAADLLEEAMAQLAVVTRSANAESARKACMTIIATATGARPPAAGPSDQPRAGSEMDASAWPTDGRTATPSGKAPPSTCPKRSDRAESGRTGQDRATPGSPGQTRRGPDSPKALPSHSLTATTPRTGPRTPMALPAAGPAAPTASLDIRGVTEAFGAGDSAGTVAFGGAVQARARDDRTNRAEPGTSGQLRAEPGRPGQVADPETSLNVLLALGLCQPSATEPVHRLGGPIRGLPAWLEALTPQPARDIPGRPPRAAARPARKARRRKRR